MYHYAGIEVSLEASSVCVIDGSGKIVREAKVASEPEALIAWFGSLTAPNPESRGGHGKAIWIPGLRKSAPRNDAEEMERHRRDSTPSTPAAAIARP